MTAGDRWLAIYAGDPGWCQDGQHVITTPPSIGAVTGERLANTRSHMTLPKNGCSELSPGDNSRHVIDPNRAIGYPLFETIDQISGRMTTIS
jgi:hypothetical protein